MLIKYGGHMKLLQIGTTWEGATFINVDNYDSFRFTKNNIKGPGGSHLDITYIFEGMKNGEWELVCKLEDNRSYHELLEKFKKLVI
jgi:hypothetical protein